MKETITSSVEETKKFAKDFAKKLRSPTTIVLYGNLASGKTTFIQGLAQGLGIEKRVLSPTFVFIRPYQLTDSNQEKFYHVDLYRLDSEKDVEAIGLKEILDDRNAIVAIEWPEKVEKVLPENTVKFQLENLGENKRKIKVI